MIWGIMTNIALNGYQGWWEEIIDLAVSLN
jgi:hypothetical protein